MSVNELLNTMGRLSSVMMIPGLRRRCCCISELNEQNSRKEIKALSADGLPGLEDTDVRNQWLNMKSVTFSNVYEAIELLQNLE